MSDLGDRDYPLPAHALALWLAGDRLCIGLSATRQANGEFSRAHTVVVPLDRCDFARTESGAVAASGSGWAALLDILKSRERVGRQKIGEKSEPTQWNLDQALKAMKSYDTQGQVKLSEEDVGL